MDTAIAAQRQGLDVLLIEKDKIGGTCLNRGCIPTKALLRWAQQALTVRELVGNEEFSGLTFDGISVPAVVDRKDEVVNQLREGATMSLAKVNIVRGEAEFKDSKTVTVDGVEYTAPKIIIATGSKPTVLNIPGAETALTSDDLLNPGAQWNEEFNSLVIIGGGVIGIELATIFQALYPEKEITVIEYCKEILPPFDREIAKRLRMALTKRGIKFVTGASVTNISGGRKVTYDKNGKPGEVEADIIVMATGRRPVFPKGLDKAGIDYTPKGIVADEHFATNVAGVYAIGDVNGKCMLAHAATAQGKTVIGEAVDCGVIPSAVFSIPECAMVGLTEEECKERGLEYTVKKAFFRANGKSVCMGESDGLVKIILNNENILGAHIMGPHASDLIAEVALAMANGLGASNIASTIHSHPTLNEIIVAALNE